jgi:hypothetical protein
MTVLGSTYGLTRTAWEYVADAGLVHRCASPGEGAVVSGPHDLCFHAKRIIDLRLRQGELALVTSRGELRAVLMEGHHPLCVGEAGECGATADCLVHFLDLQAALTIDWRQHLPVPGAVSGPTVRAAHGSFTVRITDPLRFHAALLRDRPGDGVENCRETLGHFVPSLIAIRLARGRREGTSQSPTALTPDCLAGELAEYGLTCTALSVAFDD